MASQVSLSYAACLAYAYVMSRKLPGEVGPRRRRRSTQSGKRPRCRPRRGRAGVRRRFPWCLRRSETAPLPPRSTYHVPRSGDPRHAATADQVYHFTTHAGKSRRFRRSRKALLPMCHRRVRQQGLGTTGDREKWESVQRERSSRGARARGSRVSADSIPSSAVPITLGSRRPWNPGLDFLRHRLCYRPGLSVTRKLPTP